MKLVQKAIGANVRARQHWEAATELVKQLGWGPS